VRTVGFKGVLLFDTSKEKVLSGRWEISPQNRHLGAVIVIVIVVVAVVIAGGYFLLKGENRQPRGGGRFTVTLEPESITMKLYENRTITATVTSTGFEGEISISRMYESFQGPSLGNRVDFPEKRFIEAGGEVIMTIGICYGGTLEEPTNSILSVTAHGRKPWQTWENRENWIWVTSNSISITITPS